MGHELYHHGIMGMKWGVRRTPEQLGHRVSRRTSRTKSRDSEKSSEARRKHIRDLSDDELKARIQRLEMEKKYRDLLKSENEAKSTRGKNFVLHVLEASGKNIATQATTYAMGSMINKMVGNDIVNPKKGQKDK